MADPASETHSHRRAVALAVAVALVGGLASATLWKALRGYEFRQIHRTSAVVAEGLANELAARLERRVSVARDLAGYWDVPGRARWEREAAFHARQNDFASVARVDPQGGETWVVTPPGAEPPKVVNPAGARAIETAVRRAGREGRETTAGPYRIAGGGYGLWLVFPVPHPDRPPGLLVVTLALDSVLDRFLTARAAGYSLVLRTNGTELYRRGDGSHEASSAAFSVRLSNGVDLRGFLQPTPALVAHETTPLPAMVLAAGLLISALLAVALWQAHVARARAGALDAANRLVRQEIAAASSAEAALRKLNAELEERVQERTRELRELVGDLEAFNYSVSHDLRSPLGAVVNFASILEEDHRDDLDAQGLDYLGRISASAQYALALMNDLLDFSRLGREELRRRPVDVQALVAEVLAELAPSDRASRAPRIEVGTLAPANADPRMLRLVFSNLLSNALKFSSGREHPRIEIDGREEGDSVAYRVRDNGVGFDPGLSHRLFSVFERLHSKEDFGGSGVGLASAARIVRRHGGRIWAEGAPDAGASFHFTLERTGSSRGHAEPT